MKVFPTTLHVQPSTKTWELLFHNKPCLGFFQNLAISLAFPTDLYGIEYQFPKSYPLTAAKIEKPGHWSVPCLVSFLPESIYSVAADSFADFRARVFRLPSWTQDQEPFRNCPVLHCQIRTAEGSSLIGYTTTGLFTSPVRESHCRTTPTMEVSSLQDCRTLRFLVFWVWLTVLLFFYIYKILYNYIS